MQEQSGSVGFGLDWTAVSKSLGQTSLGPPGTGWPVSLLILISREVLWPLSYFLALREGLRGQHYKKASLLDLQVRPVE